MNHLENGVSVSSDIDTFIHEIINGDHFTARYFFIVHLLDGVLVGEQCIQAQEMLIKALSVNEIIELHIFNEEKEYFASRVNGQLVLYKPLEHKAETAEENNTRVITRNYIIEKARNKDSEKHFNKHFKKLVVKEYVEYDEFYLAYVDKTVLFKLEEGNYGE